MILLVVYGRVAGTIGRRWIPDEVQEIVSGSHDVNCQIGDLKSPTFRVQDGCLQTELSAKLRVH